MIIKALSKKAKIYGILNKVLIVRPKNPIKIINGTIVKKNSARKEEIKNTGKFLMTITYTTNTTILEITVLTKIWKIWLKKIFLFRENPIK